MKVYLLICEHHNGRNIYACATEERAWARLDSTYKSGGSSRRGRIASERVDPTPGDPQTMTPDQRIETFYTYWEGKRREDWDIEDHELLE